MKKIFFIGRFPPPYGGATVKCEMLYSILLNRFEVDKFDTELKNENKCRFMTKLLFFLLRNRKNKGVICLATVSLFKFTKYINCLSSKVLSNISVFAIGGSLDELICEYKMDKNILNKYKVIYVECNGIKERLEKIGMKNIEVIPNCRITPSNREFETIENKKLRCLFMSRIDEKKGIFKIIDTFDRLDNNEYAIDFYGPIEAEIREKFISLIDKKKNIKYKGIIETHKVDIYNLINKYDVLLFPTEYGEGYPGIIAECKIAGIPIISSEFKYSKEIIEDDKDGIILKENTIEELVEKIQLLHFNRECLLSLRYNSFLSADKCLIENYLDKIVNNLVD